MMSVCTVVLGFNLIGGQDGRALKPSFTGPSSHELQMLIAQLDFWHQDESQSVQG